MPQRGNSGGGCPPQGWQGGAGSLTFAPRPATPSDPGLAPDSPGSLHVTPPDPVAPSLAARAAASAARSPIQRNLWLKSLLASPDALLPALQSSSTYTATLQLKHANPPLPSAASPRRRRSCAASARRAQVGTSLPCDSLSRLNALSLVTSIKFVISRLCTSLQPSEVEVAPYLFALSIIG